MLNNTLGVSLKRILAFLKSLFGARSVAISNSRERAIEAFWLLNDFIGDLICGTRSIEYFDTPKFKAGATEEVIRRYNKMADCFLFITLAKWIEFYDRYHAVIPSEKAQTCRVLRNELVKRGVREFRKKIVGHIWHRKYRPPLRTSEIDQLENRITKGDAKQFLMWINNPNNNNFGTTVVGTSETVRDSIKEGWSLSDDELRESLKK